MDDIRRINLHGREVKAEKFDETQSNTYQVSPACEENPRSQVDDYNS